MSNQKTRWTALHIFFSVASLLCVAFIWSNSLKDATASTSDSSRVLLWLNSALESVGIHPFLTEHFVRKAAHFSEFALLGALLTATCLTAQRRASLWFVAAPISLAVAGMDELLQLLSPGRACQISDMLLDFCGAVTGIALIYLLFRLLFRRNDSSDVTARKNNSSTIT